MWLCWAGEVVYLEAVQRACVVMLMLVLLVTLVRMELACECACACHTCCRFCLWNQA